MVLFMLAEVMGIWIGRIVRRSEHYHRFCSRRDERSMFHLGQIVMRQILEFVEIGLRLKISAGKLFLGTGGKTM